MVKASQNSRKKGLITHKAQVQRIKNYYNKDQNDKKVLIISSKEKFKLQNKARRNKLIEVII
jgi:hypothetical protein